MLPYVHRIIGEHPLRPKHRDKSHACRCRVKGSSPRSAKRLLCRQNGKGICCGHHPERDVCRHQQRNHRAGNQGRRIGNPDTPHCYQLEQNVAAHTNRHGEQHQPCCPPSVIHHRQHTGHEQHQQHIPHHSPGRVAFPDKPGRPLHQSHSTPPLFRSSIACFMQAVKSIPEGQTARHTPHWQHSSTLHSIS